VVVLFYLKNGPHEATWLTEDERLWLKERLANERAQREVHHHMTLWQALSNPMVFLLSLLYFSNVVGGYGLEFFLPSIIKQRTGWTDEEHITLISAIPSLCAAFFMVLVGRHSDKTGERRFHVGGSMAMAAVGLTLIAFAKGPVLTVIGMCLAVSGRWACTSTFWGLPTAFLSGTAAAGGIALINSLGNLGGYAGPTIMGYLKDPSGSYVRGLLILAACFLFGAVLSCSLRMRKVTAPA
jgi:nitrate/nitrite transporter NarK